LLLVSPHLASSAGRGIENDAEGVEKDAGEVDEDAEGDEDNEEAVPSVVANRTCLKTKPVAKSVSGNEENGSGDGEGAADVRKGPPSKKRKGPVDAEDEDGGENAVTNKKSKPAPKKATKGKAVAKKAT